MLEGVADLRKLRGGASIVGAFHLPFSSAGQPLVKPLIAFVSGAPEYLPGRGRPVKQTQLPPLIPLWDQVCLHTQVVSGCLTVPVVVASVLASD